MKLCKRFFNKPILWVVGRIREKQHFYYMKKTFISVFKMQGLCQSSWGNVAIPKMLILLLHILKVCFFTYLVSSSERHLSALIT